MTCFWWSRTRFVGTVALVLLAAACGRERTNPIDPSFAGNEALSPPTNVRAEGGIGRIQLQWNAVVSNDLKGYGIWRSTVATEGYVRLGGEVADTLITTARTTYIDSTVDLSVAKVYFYRFTTVDVVDRQSELSVFISAEAQEDGRPPAQPTDLSAVADASTGFVTLTWNAPQSDANNQTLTGLETYKVFRSQDSQDAFVQIAEVPSASTAFTDSSGLVVGSQYFYRVSAVDGETNESGRSTSASITTGNTGLLTPANILTTSRIDAIDISWTAVNDPSLIGYLILRSTDTQATFLPVTSDTLFTTALTTYVDSNVVTDVVYFYKIQAVAQDPQFGVRRSPSSTFFDGVASSDETPPEAPSDVIASLIGDDLKLVALTWTAPTTDSDGNDLTGLSAYRIFRSRESATSFVLLAEVDAAQEAFSDTTVAQLTRYFYAISAVDDVGNVGPRSTSANVTTRGVARPTGVTITPGPQQLVIDWNANNEPELTGYRVLRFLDPNDSDPDQTFSTVQTTVVDSPLTAGATFVYRVVAVATGGLESEPSAFVSGAVESQLAAPSGVVATSGIGRVTVSWSSNTEAELTGYRVLRFSDPAAAAAEQTFTTVQTTYVDSPLTAGQTVVYKVQALGLGGIEGELSLFVSAQVEQDDHAPATPTQVVLEGLSNTSIQVSWTAPKTDTGGDDLTGLSTYRIYRALETEASGLVLLAQVSSNSTTHLDDGLTTGSTYIYRVSAVDAADNESALSSAVSRTALGTGIVVPTNLSAVATATPNVTLTWSATGTFDSFSVQRKEPGSNSVTGSFITIATGLTATNYVDTTVLSGRVYVYRVVARLGSSFGDNSDETTVAVP
jgi:fibronectin type 3 domain-containing protein